MLLKLLRSGAATVIRTLRPRTAGQSDFPVEHLTRLAQLHARAPIDTHLDVLYAGVMLGELRFLDLYRDCILQSETSVSPWKSFVRIRAAWNLAQYFLYALELDGLRAECGVFKGFSALLACRAASALHTAYTGAGFHLIDSFAGFPEPRTEDFIAQRQAQDGVAKFAPAYRVGDASAPLQEVQRVLKAYPEFRFHDGFIPSVLATLPDARWTFVHIDVDLFEPTLASLEYFYPRMVDRGIMICDDYGSLLFPGARKAWDQFCDRNAIRFVVLETGQSVILK